MTLERMLNEGFEKIVYCTDTASGLKAIIAIHSTVLGPGGGGVRMIPYTTEEEALDDVMRLARGMTYKNAAAGLSLGGAKTVIIGDPQATGKEDLIRALGRAIDDLDGRYLAGFDIGTSLDDMSILLQETDHVLTRPESAGGGGDVSAGTAQGVVHALRATANHLGASELSELTVAVQGLGAVGGKVASTLTTAGTRVLVTDVRPQMREYAEQIGAEWVDPELITSVDADIFCPCARGGIINDETVARLRVRAVAGAANNILAERRHGAELDARGVAYVPDYIANAGGIICDALAHEPQGFSWDEAENRITHIYQRSLQCLQESATNGRTAQDVADEIAMNRLSEAATKQSILDTTTATI